MNTVATGDNVSKLTTLGGPYSRKKTFYGNPAGTLGIVLGTKAGRELLRDCFMVVIFFIIKFVLNDKFFIIYIFFLNNCFVKKKLKICCIFSVFEIRFQA